MLVVVDGLNLFHSLQSQSPDSTSLNLRTLCKTLAITSGCENIEILYFTALVEHLDKRIRTSQFEYLSQLEESGIRVYKSEFRSQVEECLTCGSKFRRYAEKQTDVAIAAHLISSVLEKVVDEVLLFSADTDFLPALLMIKEKRPNVGLKVVSTPGYLRPVHGALRKAGVGTIRLSPELVSRHLFGEHLSTD